MEFLEPILDRADMQALVALEAHSHFTRAAEALGVSQPALTRRIRQLEARLGGALFERLPRGAKPTAAGRLLCERARTLLEEGIRAQQLARQMLAGDRGVLRVGVGLTALLSGLPEVARAFRRQCPEVQLSVRDMSSHDQITALRRDEIDVGFVRMNKDVATDLKIVPVCRDELRIACQSDLARVRPLRPSLFRQPLVVVSRPASPTFHDHVLATCRLAGYAPSMVQETNQLLMALMLVQAGVGISLVPASTRRLGLPRVRILDLPLPDASWTVGMVWSKGSANTAVVQRFLRLTREMMALPS